MNLLGAGTLDALELASLRAEVLAIAEDTDTTVSVTYRPQGDPRTYDPARAVVGYTGTPTTFTAHMGPAKVDETAGVKAGDVELLILVSDIATVAVDDRIEVASVPMVVVMATPSPIGAHTHVIARRVP